MAEETKEKILETEAVRDRIEALKKSVAEMAEYVGIEERRKKLADLEAQQASPDFWNNQAKAKDVIAATNAERAYTVPFDALVNRGDERLSRVLYLIGGTPAPDYTQFLDLCRKALKPIPWHDIQGTCGRDDACECRSCWVRRGGYNDPKVLHGK